MVSRLSMRNNRFVEMVLRRQKTFAAFSALKRRRACELTRR